MSLPILYSFRRCPYAIRSRMAIASSGAQVELREVWLKEKPEAMLSISPKATVPVLQLSDLGVIDESLEIMIWALEQSDPSDFGLLDTEGQGAELIRANDNEFKQQLDRYKYADRYPEMTATEYRTQASEFLNTLEGLLAHREFLLTDKLSFTDIAIFPFIRQFAFVDMNWFEAAGYPKLLAWLQTMLSSDLFLSVMEKYPVWQDGEPGVMFPKPGVAN